MVSTQVQEIIDYLQQLTEDQDATKRFKEKASETIGLLNQNSDLATDKAIHLLEDLSSSDLSSYYRTQVWDVISMLESSKA